MLGPQQTRLVQCSFIVITSSHSCKLELKCSLSRLCAGSVGDRTCSVGDSISRVHHFPLFSADAHGVGDRSIVLATGHRSSSFFVSWVWCWRQDDNVGDRMSEFIVFRLLCWPQCPLASLPLSCPATAASQPPSRMPLGPPAPRISASQPLALARI